MNPRRKKSHGVRSGECGGQGEKVVVSICSTSDPGLWKNTIEKHSYSRGKCGGAPSCGVTTSFPACPEMSRQSHSCFSEDIWAVHFLAGHHTENVAFWNVTLVLYVFMWLLCSPDAGIVSLHLNHRPPFSILRIHAVLRACLLFPVSNSSRSRFIMAYNLSWMANRCNIICRIICLIMWRCNEQDPVVSSPSHFWHQIVESR
jgi:hypothetical protein